MNRRLGCTAVLVVTAAGCSGETPPVPPRLADGSTARPPPVTLEGVEGASILTRVRTLEPADLGSRVARCGSRSGAGGVVQRIGVSGSSITFVDAGGREVYACDASARAMDSAWCGRAFGRLQTGRLRDPRLSVGCRGPDGKLLGFAWIQPRERARYVVVARRGYHEVYPVASDVPVRVTTDEVDRERASATFSVGEHAADGSRLAAYELEARVSG